MQISFLDLIRKNIPIIFDGAFGTRVQKENPSTADFMGKVGCNDVLNISRPDLVSKIHTEYLAAGADCIETNTFGASRKKLSEYGLESRVYEINKAGALAARSAIQKFSSGNRPLFVCGAMGPTGFLPSSSDPELSKTTFDELALMYSEQAKGLLDGGVELFLLETSQDLLEVRAALYGIRKLLRNENRSVPIIVQVTIDSAGHMLLGSNVEAFIGAAGAMGVSVLGFNCGVGPLELVPYIEKLLSMVDLPVSAQPNAGMPENIGGKAVYNMSPDRFIAELVPLVTENGLNIVGGCCGTGPDHIKALSDALKGKSVASRKSKKICFCSTGLSGKDLESVSKPVIIGERLNTQGSKKTKELVLAGNYDELFQIAREQQRRDSSLLDICVAVNERDDESESMERMVKYLRDRSETPFCIDSTEVSVMTSALKVNPGSMLLNSINLEHGGERARKALELARDFGCPVIALTIDDQGMAKTIERKLELAKALRKLACEEYGLPEHYLYIDPLVFTLATGDAESADAAKTSLEAIKRIKDEMPGVRTVMGVSNVSFGLQPKARRVLNNMMLRHAVNAGLDAAIFNPLHRDDVKKYDPDVTKAADDLLFNRSPDALLKFVGFFEQDQAKASEPADMSEKIVDPEKSLYSAIVKRDRRGLKSIDELLKRMSAKEILDRILLPAMAEVGSKMSTGELILPFVLQAAEIMQAAIAVLEPHLKSGEQINKGKIVLATVYGDVHDIGKNLVGSILRNQGYEVVDLGKQVALETIIEAVRRESPDAVGLSALLVTTSRQMTACVQEFHKLGIAVPVLIGGAAVNREFASRIAVLDDGEKYEGGVYFAKDAFEASRVLDNLKSGKGVECNVKGDQRGKVDGKMVCNRDKAEPLEYGHHIEPPFWGTGELLQWEVSNLISSINRERLFKAQWGGGRLSPEGFQTAVKEQFTPAFEKLTKEITERNLINPGGFYGYFPVITDNETVIILDPNDFHTELISFNFPRMPGKKCRSFSDYLNPNGDLVVLQIVTIGRGLGDRCREYFGNESKYSSGYFLNGIGNYIVENLADRVTNEIRRGLGIDLNVGRRYSFGYPGMPSVEEQKKIFELMSIEERLDIKLTPGFQMDPEHSTLGIFVCHPEAEYLS